MRHYVNKKWEMGNRKPMQLYAYLLKIGGHIPFCALSRWVEMQKCIRTFPRNDKFKMCISWVSFFVRASQKCVLRDLVDQPFTAV